MAWAGHCIRNYVCPTPMECPRILLRSNLKEENGQIGKAPDPDYLIVQYPGGARHNRVRGPRGELELAMPGFGTVRQARLVVVLAIHMRWDIVHKLG